MKKTPRLFPFPKNKAHPDQAKFLRRLLAFAFDTFLITVLSITLYLIYSEVSSRWTHEQSVVSRLIQAIKEGKSYTLSLGADKQMERRVKRAYLEVLEKHLSAKEFMRAQKMTAEQIEEIFEEKLKKSGSEQRVVRVESESLHILREFIVGYIYFVLFFHFGGRTLGKRAFRLKAIDLRGQKRMGWYQSFERTHGYAASTLFASLGFWQVLWDREGLTMHDKIAGTTVIQLPKKKKGFAFKGRVIKGKGRGKELGIPTMNLKPVKGRIPPYGIYALRCSLGKEEYLGVGSVGLNPTFADKDFSIEIHLFDFNRDIVNEKLDVDFIKKIRDEVAYDTAKDLVDQIHRDIQEARTYFGLGTQE